LPERAFASGEGDAFLRKSENSKYFYLSCSRKFAFSWIKLEKVAAFHFKGGQGAKTGSGGHFPGNSQTKKIAEVRAWSWPICYSPATFSDLNGVEISSFA